jgi:sodium transport system permease protein
MSSWSNLYTIVRREVRDQIRDRRTLFMIFVLPILLYPILGYGIGQFTLLLQQAPKKVELIGAENLPKEPRLLSADGTRFDPSLFDSPTEADLLVVEIAPPGPPWDDPKHWEEAVRGREVKAVVKVPQDIREKLAREQDVDIAIVYNRADEASQITELRLKEVVERWKKSIVARRLARDKRTEGYTEPVKTKGVDVATAGEVGGSVWGKLFPFLLVMMALTGAFYPAVDLCAGEKERGTMETLLISPATRTEIVIGKFLTVMLASVMTAVLNLVSMGLTGLQLAIKVGSAAADGPGGGSGFAPPTLQSAFWMALLLIPLAALFSAVCVALAVLARSMKEGQYYMTPLYMVSLPLIFLTLAPGIELNFFYSLVPITGVALLLRALIVADYATALRYFIPVLVPTIIYAAIALRWAIDQFQREDVLFRESEQFNLFIWLRHLIRDRPPRPSAGAAILCFTLILTISWFLLLIQTLMSGEGMSTWLMVAGQLTILAPPVLLAVVFTSAPASTLRLRWPNWRYLVLAAALPFALNPLVGLLGWAVKWLFPLNPAVAEAFQRLMFDIPSYPEAVALFALLPAICEEAAFRGYILSGLEGGRKQGSAIVLSALMFGILHVLLSLVQQFFNAALLGLVLGLLAIRSRSLLPGIVFHFLNNALAVSLGFWVKTRSFEVVGPWLYRDAEEGLFHPAWIVASLIVSAGLIYLLWASPGPTSKPDLEGEAT